MAAAAKLSQHAIDRGEEVNRRIDAKLEYLTFKLGEEEYGVDIQRIQELRSYDAVTKIANTPAHIKGIINLRGVIVPIVDMRIRFNPAAAATYDPLTVVVVLNVAGRVVGMVVDSVSDVQELPADAIKPAPEFGAAIDTRYVTGIGTLGDRMLILVDIDRLMAPDESHLSVAVSEALTTA